MNHQFQYDKIIQKAKSENRKKTKRNMIDYVYYENHHINPRCLGGGEEKENKVLLTAREHYVCHKLLTYIYSNNYKIALAFCYMIYGTKKQMEDKKLSLSSRDYTYLKELRSKNLSLSMKGKNKYIRTLEMRKNISEGHKGMTSPMKGKSSSLKGKKRPIEAVIKTANTRRGKKMSADFCKKQSEQRKGKKGHPSWCKGLKKEKSCSGKITKKNVYVA